ncbi:MAG: transporter [Pyrinomonadaceae bacterium]
MNEAKRRNKLHPKNRGGARTVVCWSALVLLYGLLCAAPPAAAQSTIPPVTDALPSSAALNVSDQTTESETDEPEFIVPSRPTVSNPAEFQKPGVLQLEYGYDANFRADDFRTMQRTPLALRFAISRRFLFELDNDNLLSQTPVDGLRTIGVGDTQLGLQGVAIHETPDHPALAFAYYIKLPSASVAKNLGTGRVDHSFITLVSKKVSKTTIDFNAIYLLTGRQNERGYASSGQAAVAFSRNVCEKIGVQGELSGQSRNDMQSGEVFALGAATYQLNRRAVFDAGLRFGLNAAAPRFGVFAGVTFGIADFYKSRQH